MAASAATAAEGGQDWLSDLQEQSRKKEARLQAQATMLAEQPRAMIGLRISIQSKSSDTMINAVILAWDDVGNHQLRYPNGQVLWVDLALRHFELEPVVPIEEAAAMLAEDPEALVGMRLTLQTTTKVKQKARHRGGGGGRGGGGAAAVQSEFRSLVTWLPGCVIDYEAPRHQLELENEQVLWLDLHKRQFRLLEDVLDTDDEEDETEMKELDLTGEGTSDEAHSRLLGGGDGEDEDDGDLVEPAAPQPSVWQIGPFKFSFNVG